MWKYIFICIFIFPSCNNSDPGYVSHEKWSYPNSNSSYSSAYLKNRPKSVKQFSESGLKDSDIAATIDSNRYLCYKFDLAGNIISQKMVWDTLWFEHDYLVNKDGFQSSANSTYTEGIKEDEIISQRIGNGKFKSIHYDKGNERYVDTTIFANDGNKVITIKTFDGKKTTRTYYYEMKWLKRVTDSWSDGFFSDFEYFYSKKGFLDSVVNKTSLGKVEKSIFVNNDFGDPILFWSIKSGDTVEFSRMKYRYDKFQNWIRQLTYSKSKNAGRFEDSYNLYSLPEFSLTVREINY